MKFFSRFFSKKKEVKHKVVSIVSPISGKIEKIEDVPDSVFSEKIVGDGVSIRPTGDLIVSPVDGVIGKIFDTKHAFSIESKEGIELFVHFGIDTVKLKGKGFTQLAKEQQIVRVGDPIIKYDLELLKKIAKSVITPVIISNIDNFKDLKKMEGNVVFGKTIIMTVIV